ncbi:hypothetical protein [Coraliomargarita sinensis]|uniref:hypothetical protein n=1 Tax=Coraliomargarita sinensis TaxID=2174842 RepID=UPI001304E05A|nr:hypothetical protein [Coraliomargarita sinensis]
MKPVLSIISFAALALLTVPSVLYLSGVLELESMKLLMLIATVLWYVVTPLWMEKQV